MKRELKVEKQCCELEASSVRLEKLAVSFVLFCFVFLATLGVTVVA